MEQPAHYTMSSLVRRSSIALLGFACLALGACNSEAPVENPPGQSDNAENEPQEIAVAGTQRNILAFGNSLFAGYNVPKDDSYPAKLEVALREQGVNARVINAGVSGDTSAAGRQRFEFTLNAQEDAPDLLVLELGGNDLLRGVNPAETRANLAAMIETAQSRGIDVLLMGMRAPPNVGPEFLAQFNGLYGSLAQEYDVKLVPNWLEEVAMQPELIQADRIHPTVEGIEVLVSDTANDVAAALPGNQQ